MEFNHSCWDISDLKSGIGVIRKIACVTVVGLQYLRTRLQASLFPRLNIV